MEPDGLSATLTLLQSGTKETVKRIVGYIYKASKAWEPRILKAYMSIGYRLYRV